MQILLGLVGVAAWLFCILVFQNSKSAVHEIEALIAGLIGTTAIGLAGVINAVHSLKPKPVAAAIALPAQQQTHQR